MVSVVLERSACIWGGVFENMTGLKKKTVTNALKIYLNVSCYLLGNSCVLGIVLSILCALSLIPLQTWELGMCYIKSHENVMASSYGLT